MFFTLSSWAVVLIVFAIVGGGALVGIAVGRYLRRHSEMLKEPVGVLQAALLGLVGLLLAFGLSLAVGRHQDRRAAVVSEANAIGTAYLRAQTLAEPERSRSLVVFPRYTDLVIRLSSEVPESRGERRTVGAEDVLQRQLWRLAGQSLAAAPLASAPRLTWTVSTR